MERDGEELLLPMGVEEALEAGEVALLVEGVVRVLWDLELAGVFLWRRITGLTCWFSRFFTLDGNSFN